MRNRTSPARENFKAFAEKIQEHLAQVPPVDDDRTGNLRVQRHAQRQPFVRRGFGHDVLQVGQQLR
jgi:hypothetical protein